MGGRCNERPPIWPEDQALVRRQLLPGPEEHARHPLSRGAVELFDPVLVDVLSDRRAGVAQPDGHDFDVDPGAQQGGGTGYL